MSESLQILLNGMARSGVFDSSANYRRFQHALAAATPKSFRQKVRERLVTHSARIPKPEAMFRDMIKAGEAKIVRRRFKQPLIVEVKPRRTSFGARSP